MVFQQKGVVRTNCVDCLDRTNVIQSAICQAVSLIQATKLGLVQYIADVAEDSSSRVFIRILQEIWANHGDSVSKQVLIYSVFEFNNSFYDFLVCRNECAQGRCDTGRAAKVGRSCQRLLQLGLSILFVAFV